MADETKPPVPIKPGAQKQAEPEIPTFARRQYVGQVTDKEFGSTMLGILKRASFPGESSETVTELKQICTAIEAERLVLCENSG